MGVDSSPEGPGPLESATAALVAWLAEVAGPVAQEPPADPRPDAGPARLAVWLLELLPDRQLTGSSAALRLKARHLVCGVGPAGTALLDRALAAAASGGRAAEVSFGPIPVDVWRAFGTAPRPALLFDVALVVPRAATGPSPRVRAPLDLRGGAMHPVSGRVLGPADVPMPGVRVEAAGLGVSTTSGAGGVFALPGLPAEVPVSLLVTGRGVRQLIDVPVDGPADDVTVSFDFEES
jgi:hypothetical protein